MRYLQIILISSLIFGCSGTSNFLDEDERQTGINTIPMYGHAVKTENQTNSDNQFIETTMKSLKDRRSASQYYCSKGWEFLGKNYPNIAMKRFNQAWLLDSTYFGVYWGFGVVIANRDSNDIVMMLML